MALIDNLISYWKLDGNSTDAHDSNNGSDTDITYSAANGKIVQGAGFNSTSSVISLGTDSDFKITGAFSWNCWIKASSFATNTHYLLSNSIYGNYYGYNLGVRSTDSKLFAQLQSDSATQTTNAGTALNTGTWYMATLIYDGANTTIYLNGVSDGTSSSGITIAYEAGANTKIGYMDSAPSGYGWNGAIDEVGIWSRVLTEAEITLLYRSGFGNQYPFRDKIHIIS